MIIYLEIIDFSLTNIKFNLENVIILCLNLQLTANYKKERKWLLECISLIPLIDIIILT